MNDLISRQALCEYALNQKDKSITPNDIMRFPLADAIPIEWIEARIDRLNKALREAKRHGQGQMIKWQEWELFGLKDMLEDWRKENESIK